MNRWYLGRLIRPCIMPANIHAGFRYYVCREQGVPFRELRGVGFRTLAEAKREIRASWMESKDRSA